MKELNQLIVQLLDTANPIYDNPDELSKGLIALSAHLYQIGNGIIEAERVYNLRWQTERPALKSDKACDSFMKTTEEYKDMKQKENAQKMTIEIIRSTKKRLAVLGMEFRESSY